MGLSFDLKKVKNFKELLDKDGECLPTTKAIILNCMGIGLGSITEKNLDEVWRRTQMREDVDGPMLHHGGTECFLTREDLERHIGLTTNVANESAKVWEAKLGRSAVYKFRLLGKSKRREAEEKRMKKAG